MTIRTVVALAWGIVLLVSSGAIASPPDAYVSGLLHQPLGDISSFAVAERRLTACCLGSSGEDGVEVRLDSVHGGGVSIDISPMLSADGTQREIRVRPKGWDGTIKGTLRLMSNADGQLSEEYDFSAIGASALEWRLRDGAGNILDQGSSAGPVLSWTIELESALRGSVKKSYAMARSAAGRRSAHQGFFDIAVTVAGLGPVPTHGVREIEVTPVPCAGCPNAPWEDVQSLLVTGEGLTELVLADAHLATFGVHSWGLGQAHLVENCGTNGDCDDSDPTLIADNLGSSGEDGVALDFGPNSSGGQLARGRGHVTLMKLYDDEGQELARLAESSVPGTGQGTLTPDFSAQGAAAFVAAFIGTDGTTLALEQWPNGTPLAIPDPASVCPAGQDDRWDFQEGGILEKRFCAVSGPLTLPSGTAVSGVARVRIREASRLAAPDVRRVEITSSAADPIVVTHAAAHRAVHASGIPHVATGDVASLALDGRRLTACCLGSSGEDGVEVEFASQGGGGVAIDVSSLLGATGAAREYRVRPKGWDGTIKGTLRVSSSADGAVSEEYDFSTIGATALDWRLLNAHGGVLAEGSTPGAVIAWGLAIPDTGVACNKVFDFPPDTSARSAEQGFFDRVVSVSGLTPEPVDGVRMIEVTPVEPCAGCPNGPEWNDVHALSIEGDGVPDLVVSAAHLLTFGVPAWGVGQAHVREECDDLGVRCDSTHRRVVADNLGSSGQDGVALDFGGGSTGGTFALSAKCRDCPRGHVTLLKFYDEAGEACRVAQTENPLAGQMEMQVSSLGQDALQTRVTFFSDNGTLLGTAVLDSASVLLRDMSPPDLAETWSWVGGRYVLRAGVPLRYMVPGQPPVDGVISAVFRALNPVSPRTASAVEVTSTDPNGFDLSAASATPAAVGDVDRDGDIDLADFQVVVQCLSGPGAATSPPACGALHFARCDLDADVDVDLQDCLQMQQLAGE